MLTPHQDQSDRKGKYSNEPASKETTSNEPAKKKQSSVDQLFVKSATISAEIRWVLNLVTSKNSMNSSSSSGDLFSVMFPDSDIAKRFQCGRTKALHVAHFGLAPYFHELMLSKLSDCLYIPLSFDESLNISVQESQMDIIRIWDFGTNCVATHYLGSEFVGRSTDEDVLQTFLAGISHLTSQSFCRLLQTIQI